MSPSILDTLIADLSAESKRHTRAVSAKDRHTRLAVAAVHFVISTAIAIGENPKALRDLEQHLLAALAPAYAKRKTP